MIGYDFTERLRTVLVMAREEAMRLRHEYVGTEHLLLGLLREGEGSAIPILAHLDVEPAAVRKSLEAAAPPGGGTRPTSPDLPYTSRAKKVLELAMQEFQLLGHDYVGTEHLFLGLLAEERGLAARVLREYGAGLDAARAEVVRLLGSPAGSHDRVRHVDWRTAAPGGVLRPRRVTVQVDFGDGASSVEEFERATEAIAYLRALDAFAKLSARDAEPPGPEELPPPQAGV